MLALAPRLYVGEPEAEKLLLELVNSAAINASEITIMVESAKLIVVIPLIDRPASFRHATIHSSLQAVLFSLEFED